MVTFTLNGKELEVKEGTTLLEVAREQGEEGEIEETQVSTAIRESIKLTPDVRTNTIIVSAPKESIGLIEQMIRIAEGEKLPFKQKDIKLNGWAIEWRINAEDVQSGFSPSLGTIEKISWPEDEGVRVDTGVRDGSVITPYFDSMIAKLITTAQTREEAINKMKRAEEPAPAAEPTTKDCPHCFTKIPIKAKIPRLR